MKYVYTIHTYALYESHKKKPKRYLFTYKRQVIVDKRKCNQSKWRTFYIGTHKTTSQRNTNSSRDHMSFSYRFQ